MKAGKPPILVDGIDKSYPGIKALQEVSFSVQEGELFGLIGPDGAGKTSLIRILTTLLLPDRGSAEVLGWDIKKQYRKIRNSVGYMPGRFSLYQDLSIEENLQFFAAVFGTSLEANYDFIRDIYVQIEPFKKRRAGKLSGGMKQKLALCCALIHRPEVLFLDEPTTGVDPVSRKEFWDMLQQLKTKGITILVSTPYMDEAGQCDRVALIQKGQLMRIDSPATIISEYRHPLWAVRSDRIYQLILDLRPQEWVESAYPFGEYVHLSCRNTIEAHRIRSFLEEHGHSRIELFPINANIEDCFMALMSSYETDHTSPAAY